LRLEWPTILAAIDAERIFATTTTDDVVKVLVDGESEETVTVVRREGWNEMMVDQLDLHTLTFVL
jgi:hypothetical protein